MTKPELPPVIATAVHLLLFIGFLSQEILLDSGPCDISCGNLLLDGFLITLTPVSWMVALGMVIFETAGGRLRRPLLVACAAALSGTLITFAVSTIVIRATT